MDDHHPATREVHAGLDAHPYGAVNQPIDTSTTYRYASPRDRGGEYRYDRMGAPTRDELEAVIADLEGATDAFAFASGMAAIDAVLATLEPGDHVVAEHNVYAETHDLLAEDYPAYGIDVTRVDTRDPDAIDAAVREETALVYLETPTNPLLHIADIEAAVDAAGSVGARVAVDNTFASPVLQRPLTLGADVVIESLTKYVGGHSDVLLGSVATADADLASSIERIQYTRGAIPGPHGCYLAIRGSRTLSRRVDAQSANANRIAKWLDDHPEVATVHYPGLETHPNHAVADRQMDAFGGMVSFELTGGVDAAEAAVTNLEVITLAESLGGIESLIEVPSLMTHRDVPAADRRRAGITDGLIRLSVGIEHSSDLVDDLSHGLDAAASP